MRNLNELLAAPNPAWPLVQSWIAEASNPVEVLPPHKESRAESLLAIQVTVGSVLGAFACETGGLLVDHGWVRVLGSGHPRLTRSVASWNTGRTIRQPGQTPPFVLVADDVLGGFFAINGGAFDAEPGLVCYFTPDSLEWESLEIPHSEFVMWLLSGDLAKFYEGFGGMDGRPKSARFRATWRIRSTRSSPPKPTPSRTAAGCRCLSRSCTAST